MRVRFSLPAQQRAKRGVVPRSTASACRARENRMARPCPRICEDGEPGSRALSELRMPGAIRLATRGRFSLPAQQRAKRGVVPRSTASACRARENRMARPCPRICEDGEPGSRALSELRMPGAIRLATRGRFSLPAQQRAKRGVVPRSTASACRARENRMARPCPRICEDGEPGSRALSELRMPGAIRLATRGRFSLPAQQRAKRCVVPRSTASACRARENRMARPCPRICEDGEKGSRFVQERSDWYQTAVL